MRLQVGVLLLCWICWCQGWEGSPVANPKAVVTSGSARFTVLTPSLIRMEYSDNAAFRDVSTFAVLNRLLPVPQFSSNTQNGFLVIKTANLVLTYKQNSGPFTNLNLNVSLQLNGATVTWDINSAPTGNLLGTIRTLDDQNGAVDLYCPDLDPETIYDNHCTLGVISRDGWAVYDDSEGPAWNNDTWPWFAPSNTSSCNVSYENRVDCNPGDGNQQDCEKKGCCFDPVSLKLGIPYCYFSGIPINTYQDLYFFGHGHQYIQAIADFTQISGKVNMFPRYVFGPQYSRWHAFNEADEVELIEDWYEALGIPLDVLVLDMDWHYTYDQTAPVCYPPVGGWTGYTWDRDLFPNPARFLKWAHQKGLHVTNNMHPAEGVQCMEEQYPVFARAMGVDPSTNNSIAYDIQNKTYSANFMNLVLEPLSNQNISDGGIDYWWIDYQQGENRIAPAVNPTFWVNYVFTTAESWWGANTRPLIMARWGGLGNHRMSTIGFSGDVSTSWASLAFQPYFTATASNVGFFWSHDLGGFYGQPDPELFVRWIQWGAFSNLLRTHCNGKLTGGGFTRDIWEYPAYYFQIMREAFRFRSSMVPYIYTQHALTYTTGIGLLRPMYYYFAEESQAYAVPTQYMYGESMFVSPVIQPNNGNNVTTQTIWVPPGVWFEYFSGQAFTGPVSINRSYTLQEIPVFVQSGAILPLRSDIDSPAIGSAQQIPGILRLDCFPYGFSGTSSNSLYEDDGTTTGYQNGQSITTPLGLDVSGNTVTVTVGAGVGNGYTGAPTSRAYQINLIGVYPATSVNFNGNDIPYLNPADSDYFDTEYWTYDTTTLTLEINIPTPASTSQAAVAKVSFSSSLSDPLLGSGYTRKVNRLQYCKDLLDNEWGTYYPSNYPNLLLGAGSALNSNISTIAEDLATFGSLFQSAIAELNALSNTDEKTICLGYLTSA